MSTILDKSFRLFEIQTQLVFLDRAQSGDKSGYDIIRDRLYSWDKVESVVGGIHTMDYKSKVGGDLVVPHMHWYVKMKTTTKMRTILGVLNGYSVNENNNIPPDLNNPDSLVIGCAQIENIHSSFSECYDYLLHRDKKSLANPLKHEYTEEEAEAFVFGSTVEEVEADTERVGDSGSRGFRSDVPQEFLDKYGKMIEDGSLTRSRYIKDRSLVDDLDYIKYKSCFEKLFERMETVRLAHVNMEGSNMQIIYCYGDAGSGKTTYAKEYCKSLGYDFFVSGSSNDPFDGYLGEEAIILDDLRGSCFAFADLLKILDPNTRSKVKSRYYNKVVACKLIIITSILNIDQLYSMFLKNESNVEPLDQLRRRCKTLLHFTKDYVSLFLWDKETGKYKHVADNRNRYRTLYADSPMSESEMLDYAADVFMESADTLKQVSAFVKENPSVVRDAASGGFVDIPDSMLSELPFH